MNVVFWLAGIIVVLAVTLIPGLHALGNHAHEGLSFKEALYRIFFPPVPGGVRSSGLGLTVGSDWVDGQK